MSTDLSHQGGAAGSQAAEVGSSRDRQRRQARQRTCSTSGAQKGDLQDGSAQAESDRRVRAAAGRSASTSASVLPRPDICHGVDFRVLWQQHDQQHSSDVHSKAVRVGCVSRWLGQRSRFLGKSMRTTTSRRLWSRSCVRNTSPRPAPGWRRRSNAMSLERDVKRRQLRRMRASRPHLPLQLGPNPDQSTADLLLAYDIRERGRQMSNRLKLVRSMPSGSSSSSPPDSALPSPAGSSPSS